MSQPIEDFLAERKAGWLKTRLKPDQDAVEAAQLQQEAAEKFALATWLPDAARRAGQLTMTSHPGKFSHPSAQTSAVIANCQPTNDGYVRSGNVAYELDVFGNAAAMDVYKFLSLRLEDGQTVLEHLSADTPAIQQQLTVPTASYQELKQGLVSIKEAATGSKTDQLVKQVYFPVADGYHLLSLLTPAGVLARLKSTIDDMRFSEAAKEARKCRSDNHPHPTGYDDVANLTVTAFGGTKPQNISVLNAQNRGQAYLLPSTPPTLHQRQVRLPTSDFFSESLPLRPFREDLQTLHKLITDKRNNKPIRDEITACLNAIIDRVLLQAWLVRQFGVDWSVADHYENLPMVQKIWLDDSRLKQRAEEEDWLDEVAAQLARWLIWAYQRALKDVAVTLGDEELAELKQRAKQAVDESKEALR